MPAPFIDDVRRLLAEREPVITRIVLDAWDQWWRNTERPQLYRRTRATLVHNYMMTLSRHAFVADRGVHVIDGQETHFFLVEDRLLFRFKKGDENGVSNNIDTQAALAFNDPQQMLIDLPDVGRVDIVYILNTFETLVSRVLVVARDGDRVAWSYTIHPRAENIGLPTSLPIRPVSPAPASNVVRLPVANRKEESKKT